MCDPVHSSEYSEIQLQPLILLLNSRQNVSGHNLPFIYNVALIVLDLQTSYCDKSTILKTHNVSTKAKTKHLSILDSS